MKTFDVIKPYIDNPFADQLVYLIKLAIDANNECDQDNRELRYLIEPYFATVKPREVNYSEGDYGATMDDWFGPFPNTYDPVARRIKSAVINTIVKYIRDGQTGLTVSVNNISKVYLQEQYPDLFQVYEVAPDQAVLRYKIPLMTVEIGIETDLETEKDTYIVNTRTRFTYDFDNVDLILPQLPTVTE